MLSPSWLVELVSSSVKKKPTTSEQPTSQPQSQCYEAYSGSRPVPDLSNTYLPPPSQQSSLVNNHLQHSTPLPGHTQQDGMHFPGSMSLAGLSKLDLHSNLLTNGGDDHVELQEFNVQFGSNTQPSGINQQHLQPLQQQTNLSSTVQMQGPSRFYDSSNEASSSKFHQLRQDLGGSLTPSKEIEERGKLHSQISGNSTAAVEPTFLWGNETKREVKKNNPQPPAKRHKPDFSTSVFGAPSFSTNHSMQSTSSSFQNSSFYPGKTMFGGASANRPKSTNSPYQVTPSRKQVNVKSSSAYRGGVTSSSAKRILDCLERMSTPLSDAKKIPSYSSSAADSPLSFTPGVYRRRSIRQQSKNMPPVNQMSTPMAARVGENLQKTAMKQAASANSNLPSNSTVKAPEPPSTAKSADMGKVGGKMKRERSTFHSGKRQEESDEEVEMPDLPTTFTLPVGSNLPKFDFGVPPQSSQSERTFMTSSPISSAPRKPSVDESAPFTFSSPIAEAGRGVDSVPNSSKESPFTFSSPIKVDKDTPVTAASGVLSSAPSLAFSFTPTSSLKLKPTTPTAVPSPKPLKSGGVMDVLKNSAESTPLSKGSVMDVLSKTATSTKTSENAATSLPLLSDVFAKKASGWSCPTCMVQNPDTASTCPCCSEKKPSSVPEKTNSKPTVTSENQTSSAPPLSSLFKKSDSAWDCPTCMVQNPNTADKCPCCNEAKPCTKPAVTSGPSSQAQSSVGAGTSNSADKASPLSSMFNAGGWSCPTCMVQNKDELLKCPCCETAKPGAASAVVKTTPSTSIPSSQPSLAEQFKKPVGSWDCDTCMVQNKAEANKCLACETPRPGFKPQSSFTSPGGFSSIKFGMQSSSSSSTSNASGIKFGSNTTETTSSSTSTSGFVFGTGNANKVDNSSGFKFGAPLTTSQDDTAKPGDNQANSIFGSVKFGASSDSSKPSTGGFVFGASKTEPPSDDKNKASDGQAKTSDSSKENKLVGFSFGTPSQSGEGKTNSISFGTKIESKDTNGETKKPQISFGIPASTTNEDKTKSLFCNVSATSSVSSTSTPAIGSSLFGNTTGTLSNSTSSGISFGKKNSEEVKPTADAKSLITSSTGFTGFGTTANTASLPTSTTSSGIFGFGTAASKPGATNSSSAVFGTVAPTSSASSVGFGSASAAAAKPEDSKPAANPFVFGAAATSSTAPAASSKPLGAPGGFNFSAGVTSAKPLAATTTTASSGLFTFGAANTSQGSSAGALGASSPSLKRTHDASASESDAKKSAGAGAFGSAAGFGQNSAAGSVFGSSAPSFNMGASGTGSASFSFNAAASTPKTETPVFGAGSTLATQSSGFGSATTGGQSNVFGGASQPNSGFNFATAAAQKNTSGTFVFGTTDANKTSNNSTSNPFGMQPASTAAPAFGINSAATNSTNNATPSFGSSGVTTQGFNFSSTPNFNFSATSAPASDAAVPFQFKAGGENMFSAKSAGGATPKRPIRKAQRRITKK